MAIRIRRRRPRLRRLSAAFWAVSGAIVLAFIVAAAVGAIEPSDVKAITALVVALAVAWWAHGWYRLWVEEGSAKRAGRRGRAA